MFRFTVLNSYLDNKLGSEITLLSARSATGTNIALNDSDAFTNYKYILLVFIKDTRRLTSLIPRAHFKAMTENTSNYWGIDFYDGADSTRAYGLIHYKSDTTFDCMISSGGSINVVGIN